MALRILKTGDENQFFKAIFYGMPESLHNKLIEKARQLRKNKQIEPIAIHRLTTT